MRCRDGGAESTFRQARALLPRPTVTLLWYLRASAGLRCVFGAVVRPLLGVADLERSSSHSASNTRWCRRITRSPQPFSTTPPTSPNVGRGHTREATIPRSTEGSVCMLRPAQTQTPAQARSGAVLTSTARGRGPERLRPSPGPTAARPSHSSQEGNPAAS